MQKSVWSRVAPYVWIVLAAALYALGFNWCYATNHIGSGGLTGVGQILHYLVPAIPVGGSVLVMNVPLFLLGWKFLGGKLLVSSLFAMTCVSLCVDWEGALFTFQPMEPILAAVFGGVLCGAAIGWVLRQGATTGGTDLIARLLKIKLAWLPMGKLLMAVDLAVIIGVGVTFRSLESALYGVISLYIMGMVMDRVLYGMDTSKVAYIISDRYKDIAAAVMELRRGVTILNGEGAYTGQDKKVLMVAFKQKEIVQIKNLVNEIDPVAFLIVCDAHDVLGEGFKAYQKNDI